MLTLRLTKITLRLIFVSLRLIILIPRFIKLAYKNRASPHLFDSHIFIENVKPFCKVFYFL